MLCRFYLIYSSVQNQNQICILLTRPSDNHSPGPVIREVIVPIFGCHDLPKQTGTNQNGPKRTYENTETDFYGYRNRPERTLVGTETDWSRLQLIPKRTSTRTRKSRMTYDRNNPKTGRYYVCMYVCMLVGMYVGRYR